METRAGDGGKGLGGYNGPWYMGGSSRWGRGEGTKRERPVYCKSLKF